MLDKSSKNRKKVDLLWFPTGGGKTEAYLLLTATLIFFRRLMKGGLDKIDSTAMFTRYTLRALTADQFNRLATMIICAEIIRKENLGIGKDIDENSFSIGLWIGKDGTPKDFNRNPTGKNQHTLRTDAEIQKIIDDPKYKDYTRKDFRNEKILTRKETERKGGKCESPKN